MKDLYAILCFLLTITCAQAQLTGTITSNTGDTLSYASVYVEGTAKGTIANENGAYNIALAKGTYSIVYQYIGYEKSVHEITINNAFQIKDVVLKESAYQMTDIVIAADAEDPAYAIMRKAIKNREKNKNLIQSYTANVYVKGNVKMLDAPESIFGQDIGNLDGIIDDSTRQGILYLSESQSKITFERPDNIKEEMYSSIVSGSDNGLNANQFSNARFDFYDEYQEFNRSMIAPLADNAMSYYKFRLIGTTYDTDGKLVNKIKVIPKSDYQPAFFGLIYIHEDTWSLHSLDLKYTGKSIKLKMFDTIGVKQIFVPVDGFEGHPLISQTMEFSASMLGFKFGGAFNYIFSDYKLNEKMVDGTFTAEQFRMTKDAVVKDSAFWEEVRPIPLTAEEKNDYVRKDSLQQIWESKPYLDSLDSANNKFKWSDILFGYDYDNTYKKRHFTYRSPLSSIQFNAVEGSTLAIAFEARLYDSTDNKQLKINPVIRYGLDDEEIKASVNLRYRFDRKNRGFAFLGGGREYAQLDNRNPVMTNINTLYSVFAKKNLLHLYDKRYIQTSITKEVTNGFYVRPFFKFENRRPLSNNSDSSWGGKDGEEYRPNNVIGENDYRRVYNLEEHDAIIAGLRLTWYPGQKYMTFPDFKSRMQSGAPKFQMDYSKGFGDVSYDKLKLKIWDKRVNAKLFGYSAYSIEGGMFISDETVQFPDAFHFRGNETFINYESDNLSHFKLMPQYIYSTTESYAAAFFEHHFDGYILDRVPLLRSLGAKLVAGGNVMAYKDQYYYEYSVGLEGISIGPFTLFRMDYAWARDKNEFNDHGFMLGLSQMFE